MRYLFDMIAILTFKFFEFLASILSQRVAYFIAGKLGNYSYYSFFFKQRRKIFERNLKVIGVNSRKKTALSTFENIAKAMIYEFLLIPSIAKENFDQWFQLHNIERLERELAKGKGAIVLTGHEGNYELGAVMLALRGYPTTVLAIPLKSKRLTRFYVQRRESKGLKVALVGESPKKLLAQVKDTLQSNGIVAILGDRDYTGDIAEVDFFGKKAPFPKGAFTAASLFGVAVVPAFAIKREDEKYHVYFGKPIRVTKESRIDGLKQYVQDLEGRIKSTPDQWYLFDKIWEA